MSDHPDIESENEVHPIHVAHQLEQGMNAGEAGRGHPQTHDRARAHG